MDRVAVCALCFANGMVFPEDILNREDIVQHHNGGPIVNAKVTCGPAICQMLAPKHSKTFQDYADNIFTPYILCDIEVCETNQRCMGCLFSWQPKSHS